MLRTEPACSEKGVRLAHKMHVGPCTPVGTRLEKVEVCLTSEPTGRLSHLRLLLLELGERGVEGAEQARRRLERRRFVRVMGVGRGGRGHAGGQRRHHLPPPGQQGRARLRSDYVVAPLCACLYLMSLPVSTYHIGKMS